MAGTVVADTLQADSTSTLVIKNGVANTPPTIQDSVGTQIGTFCRAWVNFNGTGTVAIRASFNVTSITDNGTGDYTVNFITAMPDANFETNLTASDSNTSSLYSGSTAPRVPTVGALATGSVRVYTGYMFTSSSLQDQAYINVSVFR